MRKFIAFALIVAAVMFAGIASADDGEKLKIDDVTFGKAYKIKGYAVITFQEFSFSDIISRYDAHDYHSGTEADYACLRADIRNLSKKEAKYLGVIAVNVTYDDEYEYKGFARQYDYDLSKDSCIGDDKPIGSMYTGHYGFFCNIPNYPVQDKSAPLRMTITIDGHEFTYHIRK